MCIDHRKKELRAALRAQAKEILTPAYRQEASHALCTQLLRLPLLHALSHVAAFMALPDEPDLGAFIAHVPPSMQLHLPRVTGEHEMEFYPYRPAELSADNRYGILEPQSALAPTPPELLQAVLVPGLAFDAAGHRLGRGKGFYDNYLLRNPNALRIGVGFAFRLLPSVPFEERDQRLDAFLSEEGLIPLSDRFKSL